MALPVFAKTHQFNLNQQVTASGVVLTDCRAIMRKIKISFLGFSQTPCTTVGSCDSVTAGMDAVDRWAADSNLVWAISGSVHSWYVFKFPGIGTNAQVCIDLASATASICTVVVSKSAGFTGGSTTARPTATDEFVSLSLAAWVSGVGTGGVGHRLHVYHSTDGQVNRVVICNSGAPGGFWVIDKPTNVVAGYTNPILVGVFGTNNACMTKAAWHETATLKGQTPSPVNFSAFMTMEGREVTGTQGGSISDRQNVANAISGEWPMLPVGFFTETASAEGRHGTLYDLWFGADARVNGDTYGTNTFVQFSHLILPNDGTVILQSSS